MHVRVRACSFHSNKGCVPWVGGGRVADRPRGGRGDLGGDGPTGRRQTCGPSGRRDTPTGGVVVEADGTVWPPAGGTGGNDGSQHGECSSSPGGRLGVEGDILQNLFLARSAMDDRLTPACPTAARLRLVSSTGPGKSQGGGGKHKRKQRVELYMIKNATRTPFDPPLRAGGGESFALPLAQCVELHFQKDLPVRRLIPEPDESLDSFLVSVPKLSQRSDLGV